MKKIWIFLFVVFIFQIFLISGCANSTSEPKEAVKTEETKDNKSDDTGSKTEPVNPGTPATEPSTPTTKEPAKTDPATPAEPEPAPVIKYTISFYANSENATGSTESITAEADSTITLTANGFSLTGFKFVGWNTAADGSGTGYSDKASFKLISNLTLYAQWLSAEVPTYTIGVAPLEHGIVSLSQTIAEAGTEISITVTPDELYAFDTISVINADGTNITPIVNQENANVFTFSIGEQNVSINVTFKYVAHSITVASVKHGTVYLSKTEAVAGDEITITVTPEELYAIDSIEVNNETISVNNNSGVYKFTMPEQNVTVNVLFKYIAHSINIASVQNGTVISNKTVAVAGNEVTITLTPDNLYALDTISVKTADNTSINISANQYNGNIYTFIMPDQNVTISVIFTNTVHTVRISSTQNGSVSVNKSNAVEGDEITITTAPSSFYTVNSISVIDSNNTSITVKATQNNKNIYKFTMPGRDVKVNVTFRYTKHSITVTPSQNGTIKIDRNSYVEGNTVSCEIKPNEYYELDTLSIKDENNNDVEAKITSSKYISFIMPNSNATITATYKLVSYQVTFKSYYNSDTPFEIAESQIVQRNSTANQISLNDDAHYKGFLGWYKTPDCTEANKFDFNTPITQDTELYAKWTTIIANSSEIPTIIRLLHYSCTLKATGQINDDIINDLKPALIDLLGNIYDTSPTILVSLDLSQVGFFELPDHCFFHCYNLKSVILPDTVLSIGKEAFFGCSSLTDITLSQNLISIGSDAFYKCNSLTSITIPSSVKEIESCAFEECSLLSGNIVIPEGVEKIAAGLFKKCSSLSSITIPNTVTIIFQDAFNGCSSLRNVLIPENVKNIGVSSFAGCTSLENVIIPANVEKINESAFSGCTNIFSITIPSSVIYIGRGVFSGSSITDVIFQDTVSKWKLTISNKNETLDISGNSPSENAELFINTYKNWNWNKVKN